ncbi:multidrug resistance protein [Capsulimonas corticalis]|uniref:Multidrug resistance protein n=1 Tax=Capsulimonas corticalis TaxID=2219043 RepID=A0A402CSP1_9BACT|nr:DHA2 family efflux MFS transporter permease subunit [Capsulimonas corticalis]BDI31025.1 multidrug resistance protein [Capsulimonas corticalis]
MSTVTAERPNRNGVGSPEGRRAVLEVESEPPAPPIAAAQAANPPASRRWWIVVAAMIGAVLEVLDTSITNVAVPQMMGNLGATLSEIGWVSTGYIISNVIVLPMTGWLQDRFGRRNYFAASIAVFTLASLMCGMAHSLPALIAWRIVQGLGGGGLLATGQVIMLAAFPKEMQGFATGIFGMGVMVGPSLGPMLGGYLTDNLSWPWIFYINLPFGIAAMFLTLMFVADSRTEEQKRHRPSTDFFGAGLLAAGMGSLQTVLERGQEDDWFQSPMILSLSIVAAVALVSFVLWELYVPHPIVNLRVLKNRSLAAGSAFGIVLGIGLYATLFLLPVFLQNSQGYTAYQTGIILFPSAIMGLFSFMIAGALSQKMDPRKMLAFGALLMMAGSYGLSTLTSLSGAPEVFVPMLVRGASMGFLFIPLTVASLAGLKPEEMGVGSAMINLARQLGGSIGIAALSTTLTRRLVFHQQSVSDHLNASNPAVTDWLAGAQANLISHGVSPALAHGAALGQLARVAAGQAMILSFDDCFLMIGTAFLCALPLVLIFRKSEGGVDMGAVH